MRAKWIVIVMIMMIVLFVAGCVESTNPATGAKLYQLDPNTAAFLDKVAEGANVAEIGGNALSVFWPIAGLIAGIAGGLVGMWRRLKPQITKAQEEADLYYNTAAGVVASIEKFKAEYPEDWEKLEVELTKLIGERAEAVIRALRGLPKKV